MTYLNRTADRRTNPRLVLERAQTVIAVGQSCFAGRLPENIRHDPSRGIIAAYAWGKDYHFVLLNKLRELARFIEELVPKTKTACYTDSGPILERDFGEQAGLGFIGKNTLLIAPRMGSLFFLGEILTTLELPITPAPRMPSCGSCSRCLTVCPTGALIEPYALDARLCISYLTIEYKGVIPRELRAGIGNHVFGCDDCQDCCPWNERFACETNEEKYRGTIETQTPLLTELAAMTESDFYTRFAESAVLRTGWVGFLRNVAVALGNRQSESATEPLAELARHSSALVRLHAAWSLGRTPGASSRKLLKEVALSDSDDSVRAEAAIALSENK